MSFLGGPECSTGSNPLSQFTKHVHDDKSLQRDRLVGRGPGLQEGMRTQTGGPGGDQMLDEFAQQPSQLPHGPGPASPFAMEQMRRELERAHGGGSPAWAAEFDPGVEAPQHMDAGFHGPGFNPAEFAKYQQMNSSPVAHTSSAGVSAAPSMMNQSPMGYGMGGMGMSGMGMGMGMGGMGMMGGQYNQMGYQQPQQPQQAEGKGKARMVELDDQDWEAQFASLDAPQTEEDVDEQARRDIERELGDLDRSVPQNQDPINETDAFEDFESIWRGIKAETAHARALVDEENTFPSELNMDGLDQWDSFDGLNTHSSLRDPQLGEYLFEEHNPFESHVDPFAEGMDIMDNGGNLSLAALAFEAAVQRNADHVDAWVKLGTAQAQNEKESPAIRALERALTLDPSKLEALMGLAVSYTNEGYDSTAYRTLERWISVRYPALITGPLDSGTDLGFTDRHQLHEKVTDLFIRAAQMSPEGEQMDPDVQVGLGVLFYGAEEYDKAVDCFSAALASTEAGTTNQESTLHLLWNRLGATLANSGRSEEAIQAYERALSLRPNFVRARYNLGVSCINIGCYEEAAQHLLGALAMHRVVERESREKAKELISSAGGDGGDGANISDADVDRILLQNQSTNLYDTLRRVFSQMGRRDLSDIVGPEMDVDRFRGEFEF
ncbi:TPR-like protein [Eremomyces bilateralis CBS 781.70]|uniref:Peroxisomal targeting signal receptor n=1 Tax=Eremomyces bilateralis CBS 781.70 TaxID=1392243 RepID=A0A6G1FT32_9PEZI|nr:TPR-like protein [Eremomyces bilateralis CBS 781.70]KAF1808924.1 TPR-like protein [Eremomyces bilateralis CBS 781.70]